MLQKQAPEKDKIKFDSNTDTEHTDTPPHKPSQSQKLFLFVVADELTE